jgi:hypothetical protein
MLYSSPNSGFGIRVIGGDRIMDTSEVAKAMLHVALKDARRNLPELIAAVGRCEEFVITVDEVPAAIVSVPKESSAEELS